MNIREGIIQTFDVIRGNKIRAFLTMLGINFGVGSLIAITIIGLAFRFSISSEMGQYGSQLIWINRNWDAYAREEKQTLLDDRDVQYFINRIPGVQYNSTIFNNNAEVSFRGKKKAVQIIGVDPGHFNMFAVDLGQGRFFLDQDINLHRKVCVLRPDIAQNLFGEEDPIGQRITIYENSYTVIGLTVRQENSFLSDGSDNNTIYIPSVFVGEKIWGGSAVKYWIYVLKFERLDQVEKAIPRIENYLEKKYGLIRGKPRFRIQKFDSYIQMADKILDVISSLILVIASISLLVGGLGIMNIMLVTVTERTREIGLRMAIGARRRDILNQFIIEAVTLCLIGGGIGVLFGIGIALLVCILLKWTFIFSLLAVIAALSVSTLIGLIFGIYPAYKASRLMPIEALRVESS